MNSVIRQLRRAVLRQDAAGRTDGQLLASFIDQKDEAAFEALVRRHGPMVFGVCRRVLRNHHDAEDAFQATFLVLSRKASSVRPRERVANWLHGVALRTARKAKAMATKRQGREKQVTEMPEPETAQQDQWRDLQPLLDQELNGLPANYRLPILLCDLEGKTIREAAQQLGWPQGTLAGRLARGRKLLAKRLASRGVVLSAGSLAAVVSQNAASAAVPTSLVSSTVKGASIVAAGQMAVAGVVPVKVAALMEGVMKAMLITKLKTATVALLVVAAVATGGGLLSRTTTAAAQTADGRVPEGAREQQVTQTRTGSVMLNERNIETGFVVSVNSDAGLAGSVALNERNFGTGFLAGINPEAAPSGLYMVPFVDSGTVDQQRAVGQPERSFRGAGQESRLEPVKVDFPTAEFYYLNGLEATEPDAEKLDGEWMGRADGVAITLVFGPKDSVLLITGDGGWARGNYSVDFKKQPHHLNLHWKEPIGKFKTERVQTIMQFEGGGRVRIEVPGQDEPRPEKFTAKAVVLAKVFRLPSGEKGHPPAEKNNTPPQPPPKIIDQPTPQVRTPDSTEKKPDRVGEIFIVGNTKTATSVILKKIPLYPGQILDLQALRTAEKNLAELSPTITVLENSEGAAFKDILVRVKEK
jgi:RNA polymerase sigma factor (sigma-70 family)